MIFIRHFYFPMEFVGTFDWFRLNVTLFPLTICIDSSSKWKHKEKHDSFINTRIHAQFLRLHTQLWAFKFKFVILQRLSTESRIAFFFDWMVKRCLPISEMPIKNKQKRIIMHDNQKKKLHNFYHFCFIRSNILKKWKMFWFLPYDNLKFFLPYSVFSIIQIFSTIKFSLSSYSFSLFFSKESLLYSINFQLFQSEHFK